MNNRLKSGRKFRLLGFSAFGVVLAIAVACTSGSAKAKINFLFKDAPSAGVVAKINGETITEEQLIGDAAVEMMQLKKQEYDLKIAQLNKMLVERLIGAEAKKANLATDAYIAKNVTKGEIKISDADYKKFVKEKNIPESNINDQVKERIFAYMKDQKKEEMIQAYIAKLTKSSPVEVYFTKPKMNIQVDVGQAPWTGGEKAKVTIVEFSDFQCPFCSKGAKVVSEIKKKYGNKVKIAFKHFPLPMHNDAGPASEASMCVNEQGKFWKYHDVLFENQSKLTPADLEAHAKTAGADVKKFKECFDSKKYADFVKQDLAYGEKLGIRSTPTFVINGQLLSGALPLEQFSEIIDEELDAK
jgi:protein-disulfide isomerase